MEGTESCGRDNLNAIAGESRSPPVASVSLRIATKVRWLAAHLGPLEIVPLPLGTMYIARKSRHIIVLDMYL